VPFAASTRHLFDKENRMIGHQFKNQHKLVPLIVQVNTLWSVIHPQFSGQIQFITSVHDCYWKVTFGRGEGNSPIGQGLLTHEVSRSHTTTHDIGRTPLDEWSARRRDLYLTTRNTHNRQTSMPPTGVTSTMIRENVCVLYTKPPAVTQLLSVVTAVMTS